MQELDCLKGGIKLHRINRVIPTKDFKLILEFDNDECRVYDVEPLLLRGRVFEPLKDYEVFKTVRVELGTVTWSDELDLDPDNLYMKSKPIDLTDEETI